MDPHTNTGSRSRNMLFAWGAGLIVLMTVAAYLPAFQCGFIWDDDMYVTQNDRLPTLEGLRNIWCEPFSGPQYYPLTFTSFWLEYHLWKLQPFGYHAVNVLLHATMAILLWVVLMRLSVPGGWLAALIFALHPVHVESVAWITERKNVLSGVFYLGSLLAYLKFAGLDHSGRRDSWRSYGLAVVLFVCALLSKTATCTLPAAILLVIWWKRGRVGVRDIVMLAPMFFASVILGSITALREQSGAVGDEFAYTLIDRCLIAGRAVWFYAATLLVPCKLTFIYPRWQIDSGVWWQFLFPLGVLAVVVVLWVLRHRIGRGPLAAVLLFAGTLTPALWFVNGYFMRYSFVGDHFQYLAGISLISLIVATWSARFGKGVELEDTFVSASKNKRLAAPLRLPSVLLVVLAALTWHQTGIYKNQETLWLDTVRKNPAALIAHYNLGSFLADQGRIGEAIVHYSNALRLKPDYADAHNNLGLALAIQGKSNEAIEHYREALRIQPDFETAHNNLGAELAGLGKFPEAIPHFAAAVRLKADYFNARYNLGLALAELNKTEEAIFHYKQALRWKPDSAEAHDSLGVALARQGRAADAVMHYREALKLKPDWPSVTNKLAWILATAQDATVRHGLEAIQLAEQLNQKTGGRQFQALDTLAAAYAEVGRFMEAVATAQKALDLARAGDKKELTQEIQKRLEMYKSGQPYRAGTQLRRKADNPSYFAFSTISSFLRAMASS